MKWEHILKNVEQDGREFISNYFAELISSIGGAINSLQTNLATLLEAKAKMIEDRDAQEPLTRRVLDSMYEKSIQEIDEAIERTEKNLTRSRGLVVGIKGDERMIEGLPIGMALKSLEEYFEEQDTTVFPPLDRQKLAELLHRIGFEGKGME